MESMPGKVLLTGATGFVGSALAAELLAHGAKVVAISRNDPDGQRTRAAVREAASGFEIEADAGILDRLLIIDAADRPLVEAIDADLISDIDAVWHCAAEMSYSSNKLTAGFRTNVCGSADLYRAVAALAPTCRRFYYVSTAYTAGLAGGLTEEVLHVGNPCVNTYQITKWCTEQTLFHLHHRGTLPVTLFRPTVVVGHSRTGWVRRNGLGLYMFVEALQAARRAGVSAAVLDLPDQVKPDLVPIDQLVDDMLALTARDDQGAQFEVFQCSGGRNLTTRQMFSIIGETLGVDVSYGMPVTPFDRQVDRGIGANRPFASIDWSFSRSRLDAALKREAPRPAVSQELLARLVKWYHSHLEPYMHDGAAQPCPAP